MMEGADKFDEGFPSELQGRLTEFDESITEIEEMLKPLHSLPLSQVQAKLSALDKAKMDLFGAYAINSLFWMYLNTRGDNPKEHAVKQELDRIRRYMARVKEIQDKEKAPKLDKPATKRFVRSALWQQAHKQAEERKEQGAASPSTSQTPPGSTGRQHPGSSGSHKTKRFFDEDLKKKKKFKDG